MHASDITLDEAARTNINVVRTGVPHLARADRNEREQLP